MLDPIRLAETVLFTKRIKFKVFPKLLRCALLTILERICVRYPSSRLGNSLKRKAAMTAPSMASPKNSIRS